MAVFVVWKSYIAAKASGLKGTCESLRETLRDFSILSILSLTGDVEV